ncbi:hypothetical protein quinque_008742 [Culex quinquefasciatus]
MKVDDLKLRQFLKEDAVVSLAVPSRVASEAGDTVSNATQARVSKNAQRQIIERARTACSADPKTIAELSVPENLRISLDGDKFYHGCVKSEKGQCAFLFTTEGDLRRMARATYWTGDGTFGLSPLLCQLYTLHCSVAPNHNTSVPAVSSVLQKRRTAAAQGAQGNVCKIQAGLKTVNPNAVDHNQQLLGVVKDYKKLSIIKYLDAIDAHLH